MEYDSNSINSFIEEGDIEQIKLFIENIKQENIHKKSGWLCWAISRKKFEIVKYFVFNGLMLQRNDELFLRFYFIEGFEQYLNYVRLHKVKQYD